MGSICVSTQEVLIRCSVKQAHWCCRHLYWSTFISHIADACETCFLCEMKQKIFSQLLYLWLVVNKTKSVTFPTTTTSSFMAYDIPLFSFALSLSLFYAVFSFYSSYPLLLGVINSLVSVLSFFSDFLPLCSLLITFLPPVHLLLHLPPFSAPTILSSFHPILNPYPFSFLSLHFLPLLSFCSFHSFIMYLHFLLHFLAVKSYSP